MSNKYKGRQQNVTKATPLDVDEDVDTNPTLRLLLRWHFLIYMAEIKREKIKCGPK